ncbi:helix-turn-helix domain-containing protein [Paenibacillus alginolyticus]|uniref:Helix-turn-helix domain-containing protein n=1 Tax=Paenibacillus alginolyticus TaxID=59839 RepID=A0ABT4GHB1_9BACL|nr:MULTISPECIES: helix-turn-helix transcriptional regulator [Paenibacillus]MCY9664510.1 helix-turn-helix domain-containing protein [Paenibacillus alginolyticus]MCY9695582.1 helix-turn-helix domain-containing protein [Paenibacillus alginolyticus]MEC0148238.1 helix-turn-helix transcriptional regulator [Paenibacillus alginolyticus]NRF90508.1 helix-turn-helix transcriptional regulator [Paenibacillus frigoriresistens]
MKYGDRIALLREKRGLTQEELSNKIGISRAALSHYETNRREPDYETINKIANFFNVTVDYLLGRTDQPQTVLDHDVREFVEHLDLTDESILKKFSLTVDGRVLTPEEAKRFIAFVRAERSLE